jgi:hypothetical protein
LQLCIFQGIDNGEYLCITDIKLDLRKVSLERWLGKWRNTYKLFENGTVEAIEKTTPLSRFLRSIVRDTSPVTLLTARLFMLRWESDEIGQVFCDEAGDEEIYELAQYYSGKIEQTSEAY